MRTPMQELIDQAIQRSRELSEEGRLLESLAVEYIVDLAIAESMLEKEKEVIMSVYSDGLGNGLHYERGDAMDSVLDELNYYDKTFKTKER
jgi:hypothetical protein